MPAIIAPIKDQLILNAQPVAAATDVTHRIQVPPLANVVILRLMLNM
jgi:hypothetical protein